MTDGRFDAATLDRLRRERLVRIETRRHRGGPVHRTTIWIVVDDAGRALIRSWRGAGARWYREAIGGEAMALIVGRDMIPVSVALQPMPSAWRRAAASSRPSTPATRRRRR